MIVPVGVLEHEIGAGERPAPGAFARDGYVVARGLLEPDTLRELREPLIASLVSDGHVEHVDGQRDRFRWVGESPPDAEQYKGETLARAEELLLRSGVAARAIEAAWGTRPSIWRGERFALLLIMVPGAPTSIHRDIWQMMGYADATQCVNLWMPLTDIGWEDGPLAVAVRSHELADQPAEGPPMPNPVHRDALSNTLNVPPAELLAPRWRTTPFAVGDALLFRPDVVHGTAPNHGPYVRLAFVLLSQDARVPLSLRAGLSTDAARELTDLEWIALALLAAQPSSQWLLRCAFYPRGVVGRLWTEQPDDRVDRALTVLQARGLVEPCETYADDVSWLHRYFHATARGREEVSAWLSAQGPLHHGGEHLLSLKLLLSDWLGLGTESLLSDGASARETYPLPAR